MAELIRVYERIEFPAPPSQRPYVFLNMVCTIDGKSVSGDRSEHVWDLGSQADHQALRDLESHADAVMIGAQTLRATPRLWYENRLWKIVATQSGDLPWSSRFFTDDPSRAIVLYFGETPACPHAQTSLWKFEKLAEALTALRNKLNVRYLVLEGGSELNAVMLSQGFVDEVFLTIAPKIKLGRETPTIAGGTPLPREAMLLFQLIDHTAVEDEVFLRYRARSR